MKPGMKKNIIKLISLYKDLELKAHLGVGV